MADIRDTSPRLALPTAGAVTSLTTLAERPHAWRVVLAAGLAVLGVATGTAVLQTSNPASADTFLSVFHNAGVRLPGGAIEPAVEGQRLPRGATVVTGTGGGAQLTAAGRTVYLGATSSLEVLDGVSEDLQQGQAMIDSRHGARLALQTTAGAVSSPAGALTRVEEQTAFLRVGVYDGSATVTPVGRSLHANVRTLFQVEVPYSSVPNAATPLALRPQDPWDERLASDLVSADVELRGLAAGLAGADGATVLTKLASYTTSPQPGAGRGEAALSVLVANAATQAGPVAKALSTVQSYRDEGGSWGVVAALVGAPVSAVETQIDCVLTCKAAPPTSTAISGSTGPSSVVPTASVTTAPAPTPAPSVSALPSSTPAPRPTSSPTATPTTPVAGRPSPSPTGLVNTLVNTVLGLLPSPAAKTSKPVATPSPTPASLLGLPIGH